MGIMTLALSLLSIIPMTISFVNRVFMAQVMTHILQKLKEEEEDGGKGMFDWYIGSKRR